MPAPRASVSRPCSCVTGSPRMGPPPGASTCCAAGVASRMHPDASSAMRTSVAASQKSACRDSRSSAWPLLRRSKYMFSIRRAAATTSCRARAWAARSEGRSVVMSSTPASRPPAPKMGATVQLTPVSDSAKWSCMTIDSGRCSCRHRPMPLVPWRSSDQIEPGSTSSALQAASTVSLERKLSTTPWASVSMTT